MSADDGIYILQAKDGFRVIHAQAIDNLYWWWDDERLYDDEWVKSEEARGVENPYYGKGGSSRELNPRFIYNYFKDSKVFKTRNEALDEVDRIYLKIMKSDVPFTEYGVSFIEGWEDKEFPKY